MYSVQHAVFLLSAVTAVKANFEDTRCRCTCPSTKYFAKPNSTIDDNYRRYYTKTNVNSGKCNPQNVVKQTVVGIVDDTHVDAFLANCDCKFESRNTVLLKVVVIFVICVLFVLGTYMGFLIILDPMLRRQRQSIPYRRQDDEAC
ncbi:Protein R12C12.6 a [Aphelenchoides avenae]|nr:Protein R12C12.6 a [Aphelenchus avenae]